MNIVCACACDKSDYTLTDDCCPLQHTYINMPSGFAGWFTTDFFGNDPQHPLPCPTTLSTAPDVGYTHWVRYLTLLCLLYCCLCFVCDTPTTTTFQGQQVFHLLQPLDLNPGDKARQLVRC